MREKLAIALMVVTVVSATALTVVLTRALADPPGAAASAAHAHGDAGSGEMDVPVPVPDMPVSSPGAGDVFELIDDRGRRLRLAAVPRRIVSLAPHATELLFAAGLGPSVVAVDPDTNEPVEARSLPRVASLPQPSVETLLALRPDLVVGWAPGLPAGFVGQLAAFGVPVFVSDPRTLDDVSSTLRRFSALAAGREPQRGVDAAPGREAGVAAVGVAAEFAARLAALRGSWAGRRPVPVFVQIWGAPLITVGERDVMADALRSCGGVNIAANLPSAAPQVDVETVLAARPRLIVATDSPSARMRWQQLGMLAPAGSADFVYIDPDLLQRPGPRVLDAVETLCRAIDEARERMTPAG